MYQEIFVYAVNALNGKACVTASNYTDRSTVTTKGSWTSGQVDGSYEYVLSTSMDAKKLKSSNAEAVFVPYLPEAGSYEVYLYVPACSKDCNQRTQVSVTTHPLANSNATTTFVDLATSKGGSTLVYSGPMDDTTTEFQPYVSVGVASNVTKPTNGTATVVLQSVQFIKQASNTTLTSMLQFTPDDLQKSNDSSIAGAYGPIGENLPYGSTVSALAVMDQKLYIAGEFAGNMANGSYHNLVGYDTTTSRMTPLSSGGLNGPVRTLLPVEAELFVGGNFSGPFSGKNQGLNNVAMYTPHGDTWTSLGGGVNGPVESLVQADKLLLVSGHHNGSLADSSATTANATSGNAWWNMTHKEWSMDTVYLSGVVYGAPIFSNHSMDTTVFAGNIEAAQQFQARGFSSASPNASLSGFPVYPDANKMYSIRAGVFWNDVRNGNVSSTILGGEFALDDGKIENVAIYENATWTGIGATWNGQINTMAVQSGYLYMGGQFTDPVKGNMSSIIIYDLVNKTFTGVPELHTSDKSPAKVNMIQYSPQDGNMVVAGNFSQAGSLACQSVCALDTAAHQWNAIGDGVSIAGEAMDFTFTAVSHFNFL